MDDPKTLSKITLMINRAVSPGILAGLKEIGVHDICVAAARAPIIRERKSLFGMGTKEDLVDTPSDIIVFLVPQEVADPVLGHAIDAGELTIYGRGSAYSEDITVPAAHEIFQEPSPISVDLEKPDRGLRSLQKVCCIVQRGQGEAIAKVALYTGAGVPVIYYGNGTGVRDKMGLLRITIPAEKEIVVVGTTRHNCESVMDLMIDVGRLEQPGKGFIYTYLLKKGLADLQVSRGDRRHAATMEQIVAAIDQMRGDTVWRRWADAKDSAKRKQRGYLTGFVDLTLFCNAGKGAELVDAAMAAGASGATINTYRHICPPDSPMARIGLSREACSMVIPSELVPDIIEAVREAGAFTDQCFGQVQVRTIKKAFTYVP
ncbi:MAG: hypothetical protein ACQET7_04095 [Thermodesulfobacteriota bacterium]